jgi:hypothetical protein
MSDWTTYEPDGEDYVPVERFGKDHWSTFAYLETRAVDAGGVIDNRKMRCHLRLHRTFAANPPNASVGSPIDGSAYPTRLKDGELPNHDDWSCLEDMAAAGLLVAEFRTAHHGWPVGGGEARIRLTPAGLEMAAKLRAHKAAGGTFAAFEPGLVSA